MLKRLQRIFKLFQRKYRLLTVCWMDEAVSFRLWETGNGEGELLGEKVVESESLKGVRYEAIVSQMLQNVGGQLTETRWVLFEEAMRPGEMRRRIPDSMADCCQYLQAETFPVGVLSASSLVEHGIYSAAEREEEAGYCVPCGRRLLFLGKGNGEFFVRLSRSQFQGEEGLLEVATDWLRQTLTLFRNKTGLPLKRIYLAWEASRCIPLQTMPAAFEAGWFPQEWPQEEKETISRGEMYLHRLAARQSWPVRHHIQIPELEKRHRFWKLERRLRFLSVILAGGWVFLLFGACQTHSAGIDPEQVARYSEMSHALRTYQERWLLVEELESRRLGPLRILGRLAHLMPETTLQRQFTVGRTGPVGDAYTLGVSGYLPGKEANAIMDGFVESIRADPLNPQVKHLNFARKGDGLAFELETVYPSGGVPE